MNGRTLWTWSAALACGFGLACGGEESVPTGASMAGAEPTAAATAPARDGWPALRVEFDPETPRVGQHVSARVHAQGGRASGLQYTYAWRVGGQAVDASGDTLQLDAEVTKGDSVEVSVSAVRGDERSAPVEASTRVGNSPPELHVVVLEPPGDLSAAHDIVAVPKATDVDGDELSFEYLWYVNGETMMASGNVLPTTAFRRGDTVAVTIRASDGEEASEEIQSRPIDVVNAVPKIVSKPGSFDDEGRFVYRVQAEDPDGDSSFSYRLASGPSGMQIDALDGTVRWEPSEDQAGEHEVEIEVRDSQGASAVQRFMMTVAFEDALTSPPASSDDS